MIILLIKVNDKVMYCQTIILIEEGWKFIFEDLKVNNARTSLFLRFLTDESSHLAHSTIKHKNKLSKKIIRAKE